MHAALLLDQQSVPSLCICMLKEEQSPKYIILATNSMVPLFDLPGDESGKTTCAKSSTNLHALRWITPKGIQPTHNGWRSCLSRCSCFLDCPAMFFKTNVWSRMLLTIFIAFPGPRKDAWIPPRDNNKMIQNQTFDKVDFQPDAGFTARDEVRSNDEKPTALTEVRTRDVQRFCPDPEGIW